jgi:hypothetical protein
VVNVLELDTAYLTVGHSMVCMNFEASVRPINYNGVWNLWKLRYVNLSYSYVNGQMYTTNSVGGTEVTEAYCQVANVYLPLSDSP